MNDVPTHYKVADEGFEPPKAVPADLQSAPVGRLGNLPYSIVSLALPFTGRSSERFTTIPNQPGTHQFETSSSCRFRPSRGETHANHYPG